MNFIAHLNHSISHMDDVVAGTAVMKKERNVIAFPKCT